jgi:hypothetical protein
MAPLSIGVTGTDLADVSRKLRRMDDKEILRRFRKELRGVAAPFVPAVRGAIAGIPVKGTSGSTGLRQRLAKAVTLRVRTSGKNAQVSILMSTGKMPDGQRSLPAMMEGTKVWRHPVFGDTDVWVGQESHPYFFPTVRPMGAASRLAAARVVKSIERDII